MKPELTHEIPTVNESWQFVIDTLKDATFQLIDVTEEEREALTTNFWNSHPSILEKYEAIQPGISEQVFLLFEQLGHGKQQENQRHFDKVVLPQIKRRAFINGMLGRQVAFPWNADD